MSAFNVGAMNKGPKPKLTHFTFVPQYFTETQTQKNRAPMRCDVPVSSNKSLKVFAAALLMGTPPVSTAGNFLHGGTRGTVTCEPPTLHTL